MTRTWRPVELVGWTADYLGGKGIEEPRLTAELLLADTLGCRRLDLYLQFERPLLPAELADFKARLKRRLRGEPLQYIAGTAAFRELELIVDRRVLIPRPETELLVGEVLAWAGSREGLDVLDVGTGSGAIALALRQEGGFVRVVATDVSEDALAVARLNRERNLPHAEIEFRQGSVFAPVAGDMFDIIVSNPPYIGELEREILPREVLGWEPGSALFAGRDGLAVLEALVTGAPDHLRPGGLLALEIGATQAAAVTDLIRRTGAYGEPAVRRDLAGRDRMVLAERDPRGPGDS